VAKEEVMIDLIQNLEDRPGLEIGLRVYGSRNTSVMIRFVVQGFGPVDAVRGQYTVRFVRSLNLEVRHP